LPKGLFLIIASFTKTSVEQNVEFILPDLINEGSHAAFAIIPVFKFSAHFYLH